MKPSKWHTRARGGVCLKAAVSNHAEGQLRRLTETARLLHRSNDTVEEIGRGVFQVAMQFYYIVSSLRLFLVCNSKQISKAASMQQVEQPLCHRETSSIPFSLQPQCPPHRARNILIDSPPNPHAIAKALAAGLRSHTTKAKTDLNDPKHAASKSKQQPLYDEDSTIPSFLPVASSSPCTKHPPRSYSKSSSHRRSARRRSEKSQHKGQRHLRAYSARRSFDLQLNLLLLLQPNNLQRHWQPQDPESKPQPRGQTARVLATRHQQHRDSHKGASQHDRASTLNSLSTSYSRREGHKNISTIPPPNSAAKVVNLQNEHPAGHIRGHAGRQITRAESCERRA
jgi:hypothetical protein